ncbi:hypothetical protein ACIBEA_30035 [Streptomyces sp. NPDC051555]|uniref:hypothetical protein n=1 Tax=Streptomyces sp. NPDC051555 TaxID=3365657 RepID=UPI0037BB97A1
MTALDRVLAEEWPDGTFGGPRPERPRYVPRTSSKSAARHQADLLAALSRTPAIRQPNRKAS